MKGSIRQAIIQLYFIYKTTTHQTDGDNLVIAAVDLHPRMDKDEISEAKLCDADGHHNSSTKRPPGAQLAANLNFDFSTSAPNIRCGRISINQSIRTLIQVDKLQRDRVNEYNVR